MDKRNVRLRFDDKDIMFDAFVENIADNGNYTWNAEGTSVVCFINGKGCAITYSHNYQCCYIETIVTYANNEMCEYLERLLNNNEDGYIYHCRINDNKKYQIVVTAKINDKK